VVWLALLMTLGVIFSIATAAKMNAPSGIERARNALGQNRLKEAEKRFRVLTISLRSGRQQEQAYYGWGQALEQLDKLDEAVGVYDKYLYDYERTGRGTGKIVDRIRGRRDSLVRELQMRQEISVNSAPVSKGRLAKREPQIIIRGATDIEPKIQVRQRPTSAEILDVFGSESALEAASDDQVEPIRADHRPEQAERLFDKYLLADKLGEGGFGEVYQAYLPVAIKIAKNPDFVDKLKRLSTLQSKVNSPRVVAPMEVNLEHDPPFVVMEHVDGPNMRQLLRAYDGLTTVNALKIMHEVSLGLQDAHRVGVLHLDLKPENVLLSVDGEVKLTDFELGCDQSESARLRMSQSLASIDTDSLKGTVAYMSPEQRVGKSLDQRSDIYTAGVMLFEALTGELPQPGDKPSDFVENLPPRIDRIFDKCFVRYERRYRNAGELVRDLEQALNIATERPNLKALIRDIRLANRMGKEQESLEAVEAPATLKRSPAQLTQKEALKVSVKGEGGKEYIQPTSFQQRYSTGEAAPDPQAMTIEAPAEYPKEAQPGAATIEIPADAVKFEAPLRPSLDSVIAARAKEARQRQAPPRLPIDQAIEARLQERLQEAKDSLESATDGHGAPVKRSPQSKERPDRALEAS
jgi:serine/threonine protein kinase